MAELMVTLDGPAASGKSTVARLVAERLQAAFLDTGATYRVATLAALRAGVDLADTAAVQKVVTQSEMELQEGGVFLNGQDVTQAIRTPELTAQVRYLAQAPEIRMLLVAWQRAFAAQHARVVTEGRDQGSVVFPDAQVTIFLTASSSERARRRQAELTASNIPCDVDQIKADILARDESDRNRQVGPLKPAPHAVTVDTTGLSIDQVVDKIVAIVKGA